VILVISIMFSMIFKLFLQHSPKIVSPLKIKFFFLYFRYIIFLMGNTKNLMYFFFPVTNYVQNIYQINIFLIEKCEIRKSGFELSLDKNYLNDVIM
jgi:hypothetical protein